MKTEIIIHWATVVICLGLTATMVITHHNVWAGVFLILALTASSVGERIVEGR